MCNHCEVTGIHIHPPLLFFFVASSCFAALCAYQDAVRLESNLNRIKFTVDGSIILIIINLSTLVIPYASAMSDLRQIACGFLSELLRSSDNSSAIKTTSP